MEKSFWMAICVVIIGWAGNVMALPYYESHEGFQSVKEGDNISFFLGLAFKNNEYGTYPYTNSSLKLKSDEASGTDAIFNSEYVDFNLFSQDFSEEKVSIKLEAFYGKDATYILYDDVFNATIFDSTATFHFDLSSTSFIKDPWGDLTIKASVTPLWNTNDFAITKVAVGGETAPVPEPTTMLLFGTGLAGLAAFSRRKTTR